MRSDLRPWWPAVAILAVLAAGYGHTVSFPFVFDDLVYFVENPFAKEAKSFLFPWRFAEFARAPTAMGLSTDLTANFILRPICYLSLYGNFILGGLEPWGYRLVNLIIHGINGLLLWRLLDQLLRGSSWSSRLDRWSQDFLPPAAALLFVAHPMQTESVTYVIQRFTSLGTLFLLVAVDSHLRADGPGRDRGSRWRFISIGALLCGMLTKEMVFTAPLLMVFLDLVVRRTHWRKALWQARWALALLPLIPTLLVLTSLAQKPGSGLLDALHVANGPVDHEFQRQYMLTQPGVILSYLRLLIWPTGLNVDPEVRPMHQISEPGVWVPVIALLGIFVGSLMGHRSKPIDGRRILVLVGTGWFFLTLGTDSTVVPLPDFMAEHRAYLPSIGFCIAVTALLDLLRTRVGRDWVRPWFAAGAIGLCVVLIALTVARNEVWRSPIALWSDAASKSPGKGRVWLNLGNAYFQAGSVDLAAEQYARAIEVDPENTAAYNNLSSVYLRTGRHQEAMGIALRGLDTPASIYHHLLHFNLGVGYAHFKDWSKSIASLHRALELASSHRPTLFELGRVYCLIGDYEKSLTQLKRFRDCGPVEPVVEQAIRELEGELQRVAYSPQ